MNVFRLAEQLAVVPPLVPPQLQFQGPLPVTVEALPAEQRPLAGTVVKIPLFEEPHVPLPGGGGVKVKIASTE
jgi:hypothetical protein